MGEQAISGTGRGGHINRTLGRWRATCRKVVLYFQFDIEKTSSGIGEIGCKTAVVPLGDLLHSFVHLREV